MTLVAEFFIQTEITAQNIQPHVQALSAADSIYDRFHALMSIIEEATCTLDSASFWEMYDAHLESDFTLRDELLNEALNVNL